MICTQIDIFQEKQKLSRENCNAWLYLMKELDIRRNCLADHWDTGCSVEVSFKIEMSMKKCVLLGCIWMSLSISAQVPEFILKDASRNERKFSLRELHKIEPESNGLRLVSTENQTLARLEWASSGLTGLSAAAWDTSSPVCYVEGDLLHVRYNAADPGKASLTLYGVDGTRLLTFTGEAFSQGENEWTVPLTGLQGLKNSLWIGRLNTNGTNHVFRFVY